MSADRQICHEAADCDRSSERHIGLLPSRHREPRPRAAAEDRAATWQGLGGAEIRAMVGGLIRRGRPLTVVLAALCQLFDTTVKGFSSSVVLLEPPVSDTPWEGREAVPAAAPGLRLHKVLPILSLTGERLGIFVVYQRVNNPNLPLCHPALLSQFTHVAGAAIEHIRGNEALKRSAALLERTQHLSSTCCFSWRVATGEINWSKELCRLFEFDPADVPVTLELIAARIHSEDFPLFREMVERARSGVSNLEFEHRIRLPDNSVRYLRVVACQTRDQEGQAEYIGAVQDVTRRRHTEDALAKLRAELARAARVTSLGVLTAAIAHEVNQPLAGIVTNASTCRRMLAADPPDVEGARETARRTIRDAERASEVVKRLRALFCKKGATRESLDLNEATQEVVALSLSEFERNKVMVRMELAGDLPLIQGDRVQLQQVILNLLLNATDAMGGVDDRPRQLVIGTKQEEDDRVHLSVRDTGVGLEPHVMDRLFDAFYTTKSSGMGIGLSVSRSIIESHNGRLWAMPNDGPGATFSFSIPCGPQDVTSAEARHVRVP